MHGDSKPMQSCYGSRTRTTTCRGLMTMSSTKCASMRKTTGCSGWTKTGSTSCGSMRAAVLQGDDEELLRFEDDVLNHLRLEDDEELLWLDDDVDEPPCG